MLGGDSADMPHDATHAVFVAEDNFRRYSGHRPMQLMGSNNAAVDLGSGQGLRQDSYNAGAIQSICRARPRRQVDGILHVNEDSYESGAGET